MSRVALSQSFTVAEVRMFVQLVRILTTGGDPNVIIRTQPFASLAGKFQRMAIKADSPTEVGDA